MTSIEPQDLYSVRLFWAETDSIIVAISYFLGSIPFGLLIAKSRGIDIRQHGSGNIGATNVMRVLGKGPGYTVFALDALKALVSVIIGKYIADHHTLATSQIHGVNLDGGHAIYHDIFFHRLPESVGAVSAAIACIVGHNFPVWLRFKGGKGMAASAGAVIGTMPIAAMICIALWGAVLLATGYVSLASLVAAVALPASTLFLIFAGVVHGWPYFYFAVAAGILAIWRHRSNIVRLMNGTENRFTRKPKTEPPAEPPPSP